MFRIEPLHPIDTLRAAAAAAVPPAETNGLRTPDLVEPAVLDPGIRLDVRYATADNFMGAPFYREARALLQRPAAEALLAVQQDLRAHGLGLIVYDAYRPWYVTKMFWDATPEALRIFVADPAHGSRHNRGCAVDVGLYDLETGEPVEMPSDYDEFTPRAHIDYPGGTERARGYRDLLCRVMEAHDYKNYEAEWWHFDYKDWREYPILNQTFDQLTTNGR